MCKFYMSLTLCLVHIMEKNILVKKFPHYVTGIARFSIAKNIKIIF